MTVLERAANRTSKRLISKHDRINDLTFTCLGSVLLRRTVSILMTRNLTPMAKSSPKVFIASIVIGMPMIQKMIVIP